MILGVIAPVSDECAIREFFELFKTAWEFYTPDRPYQVVVSINSKVPPCKARVIVIYGSKASDTDNHRSLSPKESRDTHALAFQSDKLPLFGPVVAFPSSDQRELVELEGGRSLIAAAQDGQTLMVRVGYDLCAEVRQLLTLGQTIQDADTPTLELHIDILRRILLAAGIPVAEIPATPHGYPFTTCLTHDIDQPSLRNHFLDQTAGGYLYRATLGSLLLLVRGRRSFKFALKNLQAAWDLPWIYLGWQQDPWKNFDQYTDLEAGLGATYYVIPFKAVRGGFEDGAAPAARASHYELVEIKPQLDRIKNDGCEIGTHGIDAWRDAAAGRRELTAVSPWSHTSERGVRSHWLYQQPQSNQFLETAGFTYDSSNGYNDTVGYRAGTTQVFRPLGAVNLLELPLHVMDTALFFPSHLNLGEGAAKERVLTLISNVMRHQGVLTLNWHDRSIRTERQWDRFYLELLDELKATGAWFPTAADGVAWFRKRRSASLYANLLDTKTLMIRARSPLQSDLPDLTVRISVPRRKPDDEPLEFSAPIVTTEMRLQQVLHREISL